LVHKEYLRVQLAVFLISLAIQMYMFIDTKNYGITRLPLVRMSRDIPCYVFCLMKCDKDCFECFNKNADQFRYYSIFNTAKEQTIFNLERNLSFQNSEIIQDDKNNNEIVRATLRKLKMHDTMISESQNSSILDSEDSVHK